MAADTDDASDTPRSTVALRAVEGAALPLPLRDALTRDMVRAAAEAIAERTGVRVVALETSDTGIVATLAAPQLVALGFAAELRRVTEAWHTKKFGVSLWGEVS
ncbi:MAG: hypothetical protein JNM94_04960 [Phycisphaerae bacterium]|nr:hypothetical protein [Phycisphaerae bacterium]